VDEQPTPAVDGRVHADDVRLSLRPLSAAIYGQIVVTSVVAALEVHEDTSSVDALVAVASTIVVFWAAHVYAEALARAADRRTVVGMLLAESTMLAIAIPTLWLLAFGALGWLGRSQSSWLAIIEGVLSLLVLGGIAGWRVRHTPARVVVTALVGAAFGLVVVALKVLVH
jgi:hypothetical protein